MASEREKLLKRFDEAMLGIYESARRLKPPYIASDFFGMLSDHGGKLTADILLAKSRPSSGFGELLVRGKENLKLSVEYLVLQNPWRNLFEPEQLAKARERLQEVGCERPADDSRPVPIDQALPEEVPEGVQLYEGAVRQILINRYERDPTARALCIAHYGAECTVCGFNFKSSYGPLADGFIHVHHIRKLSEIKAEYAVDPVADLRPVCPNCHAVIHMGGGSRSIEEVRLMLVMRGELT